MGSVNKLFYNYVYSDVAYTKIDPKIHFSHYGERENRFDNIRSIKFANTKRNPFTYIEIFLLYIFLKLINANLSWFSTLVKKAIVRLEYGRIKNLKISVIILNSWIKGGTFEVSNLYASTLSRNKIVLVARTFENMLRLESNPMTFEIWVDGKVIFNYTSFFSIETLNRLPTSKKIAINLFINHIMNYESSFKNLELDSFNKKYFIVNDYYLFNSKWNLFESSPQSNFRQLDIGNSINFRERLESLDILKLYESVDVFIVPSLDTFNRVSKLLFPKKCVIAYHPEIPNIENTKVRVSSRSKLIQNVLLLGDLGAYKGEEEITLVLRHFNKNSKYNFHHFGTIIKEDKLNNYVNYGKYKRDNLSNLVSELNIDFAFLPFQCFETYSFALSDIFKLGLPLVSTDIGSITERCIGRPFTILLDPNPNLNQILTAFDSVKLSDWGYDNIGYSKEVVETIMNFRRRKEFNDI